MTGEDPRRHGLWSNLQALVALRSADREEVRKAWRATHGSLLSRGFPLALTSERELAAGNHAAAREAAHALLHGARNPAGSFYLAQSHAYFGEYDACITHLSNLLYDHPHHEEGSYLLARCLAETGCKESAWRVLEALLAVCDRVKTWLEMANLVEDLDDFARLLANWSRVGDRYTGRARDNRHIARHLSLGAQRAGAYEFARHVWRRQILELNARDSRPSADATRPKVYRTDRAERALDVAATLQQANIPMFLVSGTLLGCMREGRLLAHDNDVDVGVWDDVDRSFLLSTLRGAGQFLVQPSRSDRTIRLKHLSGVGVDVFVHSRSEDDYAHGGVKMTWHNSPFELVERPFLGTSFLTPSDHDRYLTENYGDWRTPRKTFDSAFDTPNGEVINQDELVVGAYRALFDAIHSGSTSRLAFYTAALNRYEEPVSDLLRRSVR